MEYLCDTCILIDYLRGKEALEFELPLATLNVSDFRFIPNLKLV